MNSGVSGTSVRSGVDSLGTVGVMPDVPSLRVGFFGFPPGVLNDAAFSYALLKVLRCVGEVAERVSSLRLVELLAPNTDGTSAVLSDSFGLFDVAGQVGYGSAGSDACVYGRDEEGRMASDMVMLLAMEVGVRMS